MFQKVIKLSIAIILCIGMTNCGKEKLEQPKETILASVGEKTISLNEFIRRAEYTIRPQYCRGNHNIDKMIILNSLIAEKMLAIEAGEDNPLSQNEKFQLYIQGRREQAMRQWLYEEEIHNKITIDPDDMNRVYPVAGRTYNVHYLSVDDPILANAIDHKLFEQKMSFEEVHRSLGEMEILPTKKVKFADPNDPYITEAMFSDTLTKGQIIGPVKSEDGMYTFIRVHSWTTRLAITETDINQRKEEVEEHIRKIKGIERFKEYAGDIMRGKKVDFSGETLNGLIKVYGPIYLQSPEKKKDMFLKVTLDKEPGKYPPIYENLKDYMEQNKDKSLLNIDGQVWTVKEFARQLQIHPLVYRKRKFAAKEFGEQFRLAIVDMIRDKYLAKEAYKKGYDQVNAVQRNANMWKDALTYLYKKSEYLEKNNIEIKSSLDIEKHLNPYIDSLQSRYNDVIEVDVDKFNDIQLTRIDMFALQQNVPFTTIVPSFPQITTDSRLDYGSTTANNSRRIK